VLARVGYDYETERVPGRYKQAQPTGVGVMGLTLQVVEETVKFSKPAPLCGEKLHRSGVHRDRGPRSSSMRTERSACASTGRRGGQEGPRSYRRNGAATASVRDTCNTAREEGRRRPARIPEMDREASMRFLHSPSFPEPLGWISGARKTADGPRSVPCHNRLAAIIQADPERSSAVAMLPGIRSS